MMKTYRITVTDADTEQLLAEALAIGTGTPEQAEEIARRDFMGKFREQYPHVKRLKIDVYGDRPDTIFGGKKGTDENLAVGAQRAGEA